jgi:hypothetical protein
MKMRTNLILIILTLSLIVGCKNSNSSESKGTDSLNVSKEEKAFDSADYFIGTWVGVGFWGGTDAFTFEKQDDESLKVKRVTTIEGKESYASFYVFKKTKTVYLSQKGDWVYAYDLKTGNLDINGTIFKKAIK